MEINKNQSELIEQSLRRVIWEMNRAAEDPTIFDSARNALTQDVKELHRICEFINNKEFSIVLKE